MLSLRFKNSSHDPHATHFQTSVHIESDALANASHPGRPLVHSPRPPNYVESRGAGEPIAVTPGAPHTNSGRARISAALRCTQVRLIRSAALRCDFRAEVGAALPPDKQTCWRSAAAHHWKLGTGRRRGVFGVHKGCISDMWANCRSGFVACLFARSLGDSPPTATATVPIHRSPSNRGLIGSPRRFCACLRADASSIRIGDGGDGDSGDNNNMLEHPPHTHTHSHACFNDVAGIDERRVESRQELSTEGSTRSRARAMEKGACAIEENRRRRRRRR